jgi:hypothetical protein
VSNRSQVYLEYEMPSFRVTFLVCTLEVVVDISINAPHQRRHSAVHLKRQQPGFHESATIKSQNTKWARERFISPCTVPHQELPFCVEQRNKASQHPSDGPRGCGRDERCGAVGVRRLRRRTPHTAIAGTLDPSNGKHCHPRVHARFIHLLRSHGAGIIDVIGR